MTLENSPRKIYLTHVDTNRTDAGFTSLPDLLSQVRGPAVHRSVTILTDKKSADSSEVLQPNLAPEPNHSNVSSGLSLKVISFNPSKKSEVNKNWFGTEWVLHHPNAYVRGGQTEQAFKAMFSHDVIQQALANANLPTDASRVSPLDALFAYTNYRGANREVAENFATEFSRLIDQVQPHSAFEYRHYLMAPTILRNAEKLRERGVEQTWHIHTPISDSLLKHAYGRNFVGAATKVDRVLVPTDASKRNLEILIGTLKSRDASIQLPDIKVYKPGVDQAKLGLESTIFTKENYTDSAVLHSKGINFNIERLSKKQKELAHEVFASRQNIHDRWICMDRLDPTTGVAVVVRAMEIFLTKQSEILGQAALANRYRFFFVLDNWLEKAPDPLDTSQLYSAHVQSEIEKLQIKFPGIIFAAEGFAPEFKPITHALRLDCHGITGGSHEGLNQGILEHAFINRQTKTGLIIGSGSGSAIAAKEMNLPYSAFFPGAGNEYAFAEALDKTVKYGSQLQAMKGDFVGWVAWRRDTLLGRFSNLYSPSFAVVESGR